jgi:hypothetical protein
MKISWKTFLIALSYMSTLQVVADSMQVSPDKRLGYQVLLTTAHLYALYDAYAEKFPAQGPIIICQNCNKRTASLYELSGTLLGKIYRDIVFDSGDFEKMMTILQNFSWVLFQGTSTELAQFLLKTANELPHRCPACLGTTWKAATDIDTAKNIKHIPNKIKQSEVLTESQSQEGLPANVLVVGKYIDALTNATKKFMERFPDENTWPTIFCKNCKQGKMSLGKISGSIVSKAIKDIVNSNDTFEKMKTILEKFTLLLLQGTLPELAQFSLETLNKIQCECIYCNGTTWKAETVATKENNYNPQTVMTL